MIERCSAMICACQTSATDMRPSITALTASTIAILFSLVGTRSLLISQVMVRGLLILGALATGGAQGGRDRRSPRAPNVSHGLAIGGPFLSYRRPGPCS